MTKTSLYFVTLHKHPLPLETLNCCQMKNRNAVTPLLIPFILIINCIHTFSVSLLIVVVTCSRFFHHRCFSYTEVLETAKFLFSYPSLLVVLGIVSFIIALILARRRFRLSVVFCKPVVFCSIFFSAHRFVFDSRIRLATIFVHFVLIVS